jgi:hypothetical protein
MFPSSSSSVGFKASSMIYLLASSRLALAHAWIEARDKDKVDADLLATHAEPLEQLTLLPMASSRVDGGNGSVNLHGCKEEHVLHALL